MNKDDKSNIKSFLDSIKDLQLFVKPLLGTKKELYRDEQFYSEFIKLYDILNDTNSLYNMVRNYITRKPFSEEKIKINFDSPTLLSGWDLNKETSNLGVLFEKQEKYYLGIINPKTRKIFENNEEVKEDAAKENYRKMEYKLLPGPNKMLPKVFFSKSRINEFSPSEELLRKYELGMHKKGVSFDINFCHELIDFFKTSINKHEDWKNFGFKFSDTSSYKDISEFYNEVEEQGYKVEFKNYSNEYIEKMVEQGNLYLFQIYNKDFSSFSKGKPNLHTLYWKALFCEKNLVERVIKLNGDAEIFYRPKSITEDNIIRHAKGDVMKFRNACNENKRKKFEYEIIKDRRYTVDKIHFHVPITLNFKNKGETRINALVNKSIKDTTNNYVIGIDRGERNLLYLVLIDSDGKIVKQISLNEIINKYNGQEYITDYHKLLDKKEKLRSQERENWETIETIKDLKEGYLSQVIKIITDLMLEYNAIVVLEDLNFGFIRSRQKFEKQVYQKFEKALIDKLNYLCKKDIELSQNGGVLKAYQLANKFDSFKKLGKQSGVLFYIRAWNTSKMDPTTGFVNLFYDLKYKSVEETKNFFKKMDEIKYDEKENLFIYKINYLNYTGKCGDKTVWEVCSYGNRIKRVKDKKSQIWNTKEVDLTKEYISLFEKFDLDYSNGLKEKILKMNEKEFFEELLNLFKLTVQLRNSDAEQDYMVSPIKNKNGEFFDSRKAPNYMPKDADANGAYNIARKGLWIIEQIKSTEDEQLGKIKLAITDKEWLNFVQK